MITAVNPLVHRQRAVELVDDVAPARHSSDHASSLGLQLKNRTWPDPELVRTAFGVVI